MQALKISPSSCPGVKLGGYLMSLIIMSFITHNDLEFKLQNGKITGDIVMYVTIIFCSREQCWILGF